MKVIIEDKYVVAYSFVGSLKNSIEIEIENIEDFKNNFRSYKFQNEILFFDNSKVVTNDVENNAEIIE